MVFPAEDIERVLVAALLGAIVGLEREYRGKSAGFRTLALVSAGSALFTIVSFNMAVLDPNQKSDVTRIASSIITGIGFLGAGLIFKVGAEGVRGLTTAATVWVSAALGMTVGIGSYFLAIAVTALIVTVLYLMHKLEEWVAKRFDTREYMISWKATELPDIDYKSLFGEGKFRAKETKRTKCDDRITVTVTIKASEQTHKKAVEQLIGDRRVVELIY
jgi:putative Mg2+ transporter-C (MgtC) family protein